MENPLSTFCCLLCGASTYESVRVKRTGGTWYKADFFQCGGCTALFRDPARFSGHHLTLGDHQRLRPERTEGERARAQQRDEER